MEFSDIVDRAYAAANDILDNYEPAPVSDDVKAEVAEIVAEYERDRVVL